MTVVDVIIVIVIILSTLFSLIRGFVKEAISLASWILALWIAITFAPNLATALPDNIESEAVRLAISFGVLFVLTLMLGTLVNFVVSQFVKKTGLSNADRVFGIAFGLLRGILIVLAFVVVGGMFSLPQHHWWQSSGLLHRFELLAEQLQDFIPQDKMSFDQVAS